jgi:hypothetical protein
MRIRSPASDQVGRSGAGRLENGRCDQPDGLERLLQPAQSRAARTRTRLAATLADSRAAFSAAERRARARARSSPRAVARALRRGPLPALRRAARARRPQRCADREALSPARLRSRACASPACSQRACARLALSICRAVVRRASTASRARRWRCCVCCSPLRSRVLRSADCPRLCASRAQPTRTLACAAESCTRTSERVCTSRSRDRIVSMLISSAC